MSLHATEIGGTQMAPELAYDLLTRTDEETAADPGQRRLPDGAVLQPGRRRSWSPTGTRRRWAREYEGANLPWLYHKYAGHDNNRDAFQTNLVESQYMAKIMFRDWIPQAYVDHHHMGSYGARIYVPPYAEPVRPLRRSRWSGAR